MLLILFLLDVDAEHALVELAEEERAVPLELRVSEHGVGGSCTAICSLCPLYREEQATSLHLGLGYLYRCIRGEGAMSQVKILICSSSVGRKLAALMRIIDCLSQRRLNVILLLCLVLQLGRQWLQ